MKILIARMNHETNTFSPVPTPYESFGTNGPALGQAAYDENVHARTAMGAYIKLASDAGAEIVTPLSAMAFPSGTVDTDGFNQMCDSILEAVPGCDALMLDLHGAMVVKDYDDGEAELLHRIREIAPDVPIAVALDLHGNVSKAVVDAADVVVGFKTYPHIDMYETGEHAGRLLLDQLAGRIRPTSRWIQLPLMSHTLESATGKGAMQQAVQAAIQAETEGALACSVFAGFSLANIPEPFVSVVTVTDNDPQLADRISGKIADLIWEQRQGFIYQSEPLAKSISRASAEHDKAAQAAQTSGTCVKPVLLLDHSDNCMSGGTCDVMDVFEEALKQGLTDIAVGPLCDPEAVEQLIHAGVGATVTLPIGNKQPLVQLGITKTPPELTGRVRVISDGEFLVTGPTYTGLTWRMGKTVVFETDTATLVLTETPQEPLDMGVFTSVGIDPQRHAYLLLKSRMYCRPVFEPMSAAVIECDAAGATSSDYSIFPFTRLNRPVYPFDEDTRRQS